eukprot:gene20930-18120_t
MGWGGRPSLQQTDGAATAAVMEAYGADPDLGREQVSRLYGEVTKGHHARAMSDKEWEEHVVEPVKSVRQGVTSE